MLLSRTSLGFSLSLKAPCLLCGTLSTAISIGKEEGKGKREKEKGKREMKKGKEEGKEEVKGKRKKGKRKKGKRKKGK
jgi:hypothetical protein